MRIIAESLTQVEHPAFTNAPTGWRPYAHQAQVVDAWDSHDAFLITSLTGAGKTAAAAYPLMLRQQSALFVYPTNALIEDQARSIEAMFHTFGRRCLLLAANEDRTPEEYAAADAILVRVDAESLESLRAQWGYSRKGSALNHALAHPGCPVFFLTNPDTVHLILQTRYRDSWGALSALSQFDAIVVDEFHLYAGVELARICALLTLSRRLLGIRRLILLSATPQPEVEALLEKLFTPLRLPQPCPSGFSRPVAHEVEFDIVPHPGSANEIAHIVLEQLTSLQAKRRSAPGASAATPCYVPLLVIVNSVFKAIEIEDHLRRASLGKDDIGVYRGLSNRSYRDMQGKLVVLGTSAIEVGVDFDADLLIFEASSYEAFVQRLGRIGRHRPGTALFLAPPNVLTAMQALPQAMSRPEFVHCCQTWFASLDARAWFASTACGMLVTELIGASLLEGLRDPAVRAQAEEVLDGAMADMAARLNCQRHRETARRWMRKDFAWLALLRKHASFRSSIGSLPVWDSREAARRGESEGGAYEADLLTLLRYARDLRKSASDFRINGYERRHEVAPSVLSPDLDRLMTGAEAGLRILRDGLAGGIVDAMNDWSQRVVIRLPDTVSAALDWRVPRLPVGDRTSLYFDFDALLAWEVARCSQEL